jgi:hypothetical protein
MKKIYPILIIITLVSVLVTGCSKKKGDPPVLPPSGSMTIDFSYFVSGTKSAFLTEGTKGISDAENVNWTLASTIAGVWNRFLIYELSVPVAAFKVAVNQTPVFVDTKKWEWSYSVNAVGVTYKARLTGEIKATEVEWKMYVAKEGVGAYSEFLWFEGTSALDGKSGQWILNHSQLFQEPLLQIDWEVTGSSISSITYTYIRDLKDNRSADPFKGSYIEYGLTSATLNAFYTVHLNMTGVANDFEDVNIEWSTTVHNGRIKAPYYYLDTASPQWHCWDLNGNDVVCN